MTEELFWRDSYCREFDATVKSVRDGRFILLDKTAFYPEGGGQPNDTGKLTCGGQEYAVVGVLKESGGIVHEVDREGLQEGAAVSCSLDWSRRHRLMRMHTATHVLCSIIGRENGALITGNQLGIGKTRVDLSLESLNKELAQKFIDEANQELAKNLPVEIKLIPRAEAEKLTHLAKAEYEGNELRVVSVSGVGEEPCGGTHVANTSEIGKIELVGVENKGKGRKRIYFTLAGA
ncbi:alanyl-tRNA editing protein [Candidatus Micrarchaeota archaeon]|nr:alanyl-tRNA editing protein [Candidatus Micrarchaeota archaeon]